MMTHGDVQLLSCQGAHRLIQASMSTRRVTSVMAAALIMICLLVVTWRMWEAGRLAAALLGQAKGIEAEVGTLTPFQKQLVARLRAALVANNKENLPPADARRHPELFTRSLSIRRVPSLNATGFRSALAASEPLIVAAGGGVCSKTNWTFDFIRAVAGHNLVSVETSKNNRFYSNEGLKKVRMTLSSFLDEFIHPNRKFDMFLAEESLNDLPALLDDAVEPEWAAGGTVDRTQLWIGAGGQVSPLHHDQWDNVLCQMKGSRHLLLFDPLQVDRLYPKGGADRHFSSVDPSDPNAAAQFPRFADAVLYEATLEEGETLVLPSYWWHQIHHAPTPNIAVNFWYIPTSLLGELLYDVLLPQ